MNNQRRVRLIVDIAPELRRRVKVAAASQDVPVRAYVSTILDSVVPGAESPMTREDVERLHRVRASIMRGRKFDDDSVDILEAIEAMTSDDSD